MIKPHHATKTARKRHTAPTHLSCVCLGPPRDDVAADARVDRVDAFVVVAAFDAAAGFLVVPRLLPPARADVERDGALRGLRLPSPEAMLTSSSSSSGSDRSDPMSNWLRVSACESWTGSIVSLRPADSCPCLLSPLPHSSTQSQRSYFPSQSWHASWEERAPRPTPQAW